MSLRRQFILVFAAFAVVISVVGGVWAYRMTSRVLEAELDQKLIDVAWAAVEVGIQSDLILSLTPGEEDGPTFSPIQQRLRRLRRMVDQAYLFRPEATELGTEFKALVTTFDAGNIPIGSRLYELELYREQIAEASLRGWSTSDIFFREDEGRYYKFAFVRVEHGPALLAVLAPADFMEPLESFKRTVILGSLLSVIGAALLAWLLAIRITGPLDRLGRVALRIQRGRMDEEVGEEKGGELGRLSRAMERMRAGILHRDEQLRLMLAQVAHEIRNPLGGLELFASAAAETEEAEERGRLLGKVSSEIVALNRIIDDFLTFARPLRAEDRLHDIRGPVQEAVELVELLVLGSGGKVKVVFPAEPLMARADPEHVKRVTLNLLRNAAQAGQNISVRGENERGEIVISIQDDGPGVPEELEDRIFEPFVTDKEQGAGLGLAIVKRVVEANLGRVELNNGSKESGGGAEFRVYFRGIEDIQIPT
jgi:signal transduction histidine kinase